LSKGITRWWFQGCFIFTPKILEDFQFDWYFSDVWFNHQLDKHFGQCCVWNHVINPSKFKSQRWNEALGPCVSTYYTWCSGQSTDGEHTKKKSFPIGESSKGNLSRSWPKLWGDILVEVVTVPMFFCCEAFFFWRKSEMGLLKIMCWEVQKNMAVFFLWNFISRLGPAWTSDASYRGCHVLW